MTELRVVSLVPSATETMLSLGVGPIGCTRFCDYADAAIVGGTKSVDVEAIVALAPDVVVVNDEENRLEDAQALIDRGLTLHSMSPRSVADVGPAVKALATALGREPRAPWTEWDAWLDRTREPSRLGAFVPIWPRPWMTLAGDTYGSSLLEHVGIRNVFADATDRYPDVSLGSVARLEPDVALLPSEPYAFGERHAVEVRAAVPRVRVMFVDGRDLFWWGVRTPAAAVRLRDVA